MVLIALIVEQITLAHAPLVLLVKIASKTSDPASLSTRANTVLVVTIMDQITVAHVRQISLAKIASKTSDLV